MAEEVLASAAKLIRAAYARDRANRYALLAPWTFTVDCAKEGVAPFRYSGPLIGTEPADGALMRVTVKPYTAESGVCDGCSLSPDLRGCREAALFHDPWYLELEAMAAETGIPAADLRRLGDDIFGALCRALGAPGPVARLYHAAVRWFGGIAHGRLGAAIAALALALAAGCAGIPDILDGPVPPPSYERAAP